MKAVMRATQRLEEWQVYVEFATTTRQVMSQAKADLEIARSADTEENIQKRGPLEEVIKELESRWEGAQKVLAEKIGGDSLEEAIEKFERSAAAVELFRSMRRKLFGYRAAFDLECQLGITPQRRKELEEALAQVQDDMEQQGRLVSQQINPVTLLSE